MKDHGYLAMVYSRYKNIPLQILETERTYVREITTDDVKALYSLYDDEALKYVEPLYEYDEEVIFTKNILKICMDSMDTVCGLFLKKKQMN